MQFVIVFVRVYACIVLCLEAYMYDCTSLFLSIYMLRLCMHVSSCPVIVCLRLSLSLYVSVFVLSLYCLTAFVHVRTNYCTSLSVCVNLSSSVVILCVSSGICVCVSLYVSVCLCVSTCVSICLCVSLCLSRLRQPLLNLIRLTRSRNSLFPDPVISIGR